MGSDRLWGAPPSALTRSRAGWPVGRGGGCRERDTVGMLEGTLPGLVGRLEEACARRDAEVGGDGGAELARRVRQDLEACLDPRLRQVERDLLDAGVGGGPAGPVLAGDATDLLLWGAAEVVRAVGWALATGDRSRWVAVTGGRGTGRTTALDWVGREAGALPTPAKVARVSVASGPWSAADGTLRCDGDVDVLLVDDVDEVAGWPREDAEELGARMRAVCAGAGRGRGAVLVVAGTERTVAALGRGMPRRMPDAVGALGTWRLAGCLWYVADLARRNGTRVGGSISGSHHAHRALIALSAQGGGHLALTLASACKVAARRVLATHAPPTIEIGDVDLTGALVGGGWYWPAACAAPAGGRP